MPRHRRPRTQPNNPNPNYPLGGQLPQQPNHGEVPNDGLQPARVANNNTNQQESKKEEEKKQQTDDPYPNTNVWDALAEVAVCTTIPTAQLAKQAAPQVGKMLSSTAQKMMNKFKPSRQDDGDQPQPPQHR